MHDHDNHESDEIAQLGAILLGDQTMDAVLEKVVEIGRRAIPSASSASVTIVRRDTLRTTHATAREAYVLDQTQFDAGAGPVLDAIKTGERVVSAREADVDVWTHFCNRAEQLGIVGSMSTPVIAAGITYGSLNVYTREPEDFSTADIELAGLLADQASVVVANATALFEAALLHEQLQAALESRQLIGEAKGILIERERCTRDEAFDLLRRASQRENRKIRDIAEEIVRNAEGAGTLRMSTDLEP